MEKVGRYEIVAAIGRGGMGVVYHARDTLLHRDVAVKVMSVLAAGDPEMKVRFEREARAAAQLAHPNVVTIHDFGYHDDGSPFIAMELLKGRDLHQAMHEGPEIALDRKLWILAQVLAALSHAHCAGVVHRDVKPANIFLGHDGSVKVLDFGMARFTQTPASTGGIVGTADYMSPEQVRGAVVDGRCDLFSCGCVLYELLTGHRPFQADSIVTTIYKILHDEPDYGLLPPGTEPLVAVLERSLAKDLAFRYATAYEFAQDLGRILHLPPAPGRPLFEDLLKLQDPAAALPEGPTPLPDPAEPKRGDRSTVDLTRPAGATPRPGGESSRSHARPALLALLLVALLALWSSLRGRQWVSAPPPASVAAGPVASLPPRLSPQPPAAEVRSSPSPRSSAPAMKPPPDRAAAAPLSASPPASSIVTGRFEGYVTDESCKKKGATDDHWDCAQICQRKGYKLLFYTGGKLYTLVGVERIRGDKNRKVMVDGRLDLRANTLTVLDSSRSR
jgi:serine/threonine-protein kinase